MDGRSGLYQPEIIRLPRRSGEAAIRDDRKSYAAPGSSQRSRDAAAAPLMEMILSPDHW